jgi:hypothetical protein
LILDTDATEDASGNPILDYTGEPVTGQVEPALPLLASQPVRLYGAMNGSIEEIQYEILFDGTPAVNPPGEEVVVPPTYIDLVWWQEFYSDAPSRGLPRLRTAPDIDPLTKWPRETVTFADGCTPGAAQQAPVRAYIAERRINIGDGIHTITGVPGSEFSALIPCKANGLFVRLAVNLETDAEIPPDNTYRLRIWAIVGSQDNEAGKDASLLPYTPDI